MNKILLIGLLFLSSFATAEMIHREHLNKVGYRYSVESESPKKLAIGEVGMVVFSVDTSIESLAITFSAEAMDYEILEMRRVSDAKTEVAIQVYGSSNTRAYLNMFLSDEAGAAGVYSIGINIGSGQMSKPERVFSDDGVRIMQSSQAITRSSIK